MLHSLSLLEASPYASGCFLCNLCWEKGCGPVYHCTDCDFDIHVTCAATAKQQTHFSHFEHPLYLCHCSRNHVCDGCGEAIDRLAFRCDACDFDMHSMCVRAPRYILHPTHPHPLALIKASELHGVCNACNRMPMDLCYQCRQCNYQLHQSCAILPSQVKHPMHPQHVLRLQYWASKEAPTFTCAVCGGEGNKWRFQCTSCQFYVHPQCTKILHELPFAGLELSPQESISYRSATATSPMITENVSSSLTLTGDDLKGAEKVLSFAQEMQKKSVSNTTTLHSSEASTSDEQDTCPTCLDGSDHSFPPQESISHRSATSTSPMMTENVSSLLTLTADDLIGAEKVLSFAQEMLKKSVSNATTLHSSEASASDEEDTCPTCLDGYEPSNPKRSTSCGHHFHLHCILSWMERCTRCPICRKNVNIRM